MEADSVSADVVGVAPLTAERDVEAETRLVAALMEEELAGNHRGGGLYTYVSDRGQVSVRAGGEISLTPSADPHWLTDDPAAHAAALMAALPVDTELIGADIAGGDGSVTYRQRWEGAPLFSCQVTLTYREGRLTGLSGSLLAVERTAAESAELLTLPTVLMRFLDGILDSGDVCSAVRTVEPGYRMSQSFSGAVRLSSVWHISTDMTDYYLDGITGEFSWASEGRSVS